MTLLDSSYDNVDRTAYTTASVSPRSNALILLVISLGGTTINNGVEPTIAGNGLTWVLVNSVQYSTIAATTRYLGVYRAMGAAPTAGAITITTKASFLSNHGGWFVCEFMGVDTSGTNGSGAVVQSATNRSDGATSLGATLSAFGKSYNQSFITAGHVANEAVSASAPLSLIGSISGASPSMGDGAGLVTDNVLTPTLSWTTSAACGAVAVEIKTNPSVPNNYQFARDADTTDTGILGFTEKIR